MWTSQIMMQHFTVLVKFTTLWWPSQHLRRQPSCGHMKLLHSNNSLLCETTPCSSHSCWDLALSIPAQCIFTLEAESSNTSGIVCGTFKISFIFMLFCGHDICIGVSYEQLQPIKNVDACFYLCMPA